MATDKKFTDLITKLETVGKLETTLPSDFIEVLKKQSLNATTIAGLLAEIAAAKQASLVFFSPFLFPITVSLVRLYNSSATSSTGMSGSSLNIVIP